MHEPRELTDHLAVLAASGSRVTLGPIGFAATVTPELAAYRALAADRDALARHEAALVTMLDAAEPGPVVYAALLLEQLGRDVAPLLARFADDRRPLHLWMGGCSPSPPTWLAEWVRSRGGAPWTHPDHAAEQAARARDEKLASLAQARWFELPSRDALELARKGIRPRDIEGRWVFDFLALLNGPRAELRALNLATLAAAGALPGRLYGALLLREVDRNSTVLDAIAAAGGEVPCLRARSFVDKLVGASAVKPRPIADVVAELRDLRW